MSLLLKIVKNDLKLSNSPKSGLLIQEMIDKIYIVNFDIYDNDILHAIITTDSISQ